jgi:hypothetical protein
MNSKYWANISRFGQYRETELSLQYIVLNKRKNGNAHICESYINIPSSQTQKYLTFRSSMLSVFADLYV